MQDQCPMAGAVLYRSVVLATSLLAGAASAGLHDTSYPIGATPGTWQQDRYAPAVFTNGGTVAGRSGVLSLGVAAADSLASRPPAFASTFYNTQGRGLVLNLPNYAVVYGSVYIPSTWTTSSGPLENRRTDMWGQASPATGGDTCVASGCNFFPYIGFSNASPTSPTTTGGTGRYRVYDGTVGVVDLALPVQYDQWSDVCIAFSGTDFKSYINGALVYTQTDMAHNDIATLGPTTHFSRVIMQAYNFGADYTAQWGGLGAGQLSAVSTQAGSGQAALPGTVFSTPLAVIARDAGGTPLPCVPVTFTVPASGASATVASTTVMTDRFGVATVAATANGILGEFTVSATAPGLDVPATFALRNGAAVAAPVQPVPISPATGMAASVLLLLSVVWLRRRPGTQG